MLNKKRVIRFLISLALAVTLTTGAGSAGIFGFPQAPSAMACGTSSGIGGGC